MKFVFTPSPPSFLPLCGLQWVPYGAECPGPERNVRGPYFLGSGSVDAFKSVDVDVSIQIFVDTKKRKILQDQMFLQDVLSQKKKNEDLTVCLDPRVKL